MTGSDDEFDDFLRRRKPVFRRDDDGLEPPAELDRIVLRQAREAIEAERPQRVFRAPRWGTPIALAATVLVALSVMIHVGMPAKGPVGEVTVRNISREVGPSAAPAMAANEAADQAADSSATRISEPVAGNGAVIVDLAPGEHASTVPHQELARATRARESGAAAAPVAPAPGGFVADAEASRYAEPPPAAPSAEATVAASRRPEMQTSTPAPVDAGASLAKASPDTPAWRRDSKTWLAEIARLRAAGEIARAEAEMAEYNRQQRAYAGAPDR